jgi:hypothetical protein
MKQNQSRSFLLVGAVVVLLFFAYVMVGIINKNSYKESREMVTSLEVPPQTEVSAPVPSEVSVAGSVAGTYTDTTTGFVLALPKSWQEIGYKISSTTATSGVVTYNVTLVYRDATGAHPGFGTSEIVAVPSGIDSGPYKFGGPMNSVEDGIEIGKNSKFTFISKQLSPEAFGSCAQDQTFAKQNERLCKEGSTIMNPERVSGAFKTLE